MSDWYTYLPSNLPFFSHFTLGSASCSDLEMAYLRCANVTGLRNSKFRCKEQLDDLIECRFKLTSDLRKHKIREERRKQERDPLDGSLFNNKQ